MKGLSSSVARMESRRTRQVYDSLCLAHYYNIDVIRKQLDSRYL
jgi:hypothetical protein